MQAWPSSCNATANLAGKGYISPALVIRLFQPLLKGSGSIGRSLHRLKDAATTNNKVSGMMVINNHELPASRSNAVVRLETGCVALPTRFLIFLLNLSNAMSMYHTSTPNFWAASP